MDAQGSSSKDKLDTYLYSTNNVVDRMVQAPYSRVLRSTSKTTTDKGHINTTYLKGKDKDKKKDETAVHRLEKWMDGRTNATLLRDAKMYQQGKA